MEKVNPFKSQASVVKSEAKAVSEEKMITVKALTKVFFQNRRIEEGDVFQIKESDFNEKVLEKVVESK